MNFVHFFVKFSNYFRWKNDDLSLFRFDNFWHSAFGYLLIKILANDDHDYFWL